MGSEVTRFRKGRSGNPGGRPKVVAEVRDLAQAHTADAIEALAKICRTGKSESARVSAAVALLDRGYGKPLQTVSTSRPSIVELSDEQLLEIAAGELEAPTGLRH